MEELKIQISNAGELTAALDGPGYMVLAQNENQITIHLVQALALAEFILANRAAMTEAYKRHCRGK